MVETLGLRLRNQRARVSKRSRLREKLAYIAYRWDGLNTLLDDGRVERDSNCLENRNRPVALTKKNALFAGHDAGAPARGRIAWLVETANMNGGEPFAWLTATLEAIAVGHPNNCIDDLMPWAFNPSSTCYPRGVLDTMNHRTDCTMAHCNA